MVTWWTQVKIALVLWKAFLYLFSTVKPKHDRSTENKNLNITIV